MESPNAAELCARAQQLVAGIRKLAANKAADIPAVSISVGGAFAAAAQEWAIRYSQADTALYRVKADGGNGWRSEEHTSELQSLMRISYAVFCLKKKTTTKRTK